jgi:hypothetical protein
MQGRMNSGRAGVIVLLFVAACGASGGMTQVANGTAVDHSPSASSTLKPTRTPVTPTVPMVVNTIVAIPSPTEGAPPDLELVNATIRYDGYGSGYLFAGIRNNTDSAMVFRSPKGEDDYPLFRFYINAWDWSEINGIYWIYEFEVSYMGPNTNCFLYPGETGVLQTEPTSCAQDKKNCTYESDFLNKPPAATGMQLVGYEVIENYESWPGLETEYHPHAENIEFSAENYKIQFGFDLPKSFFNDLAWYDYPAWVMIIGKDGGTLEILFRENISDILTEMDDTTWRINGFYKTESSTEESGPGRFLGYLPDKYWDQIDHIEVFVEKQHDFLCGNYQDFNYYREKKSEETV